MSQQTNQQQQRYRSVETINGYGVIDAQAGRLEYYGAYRSDICVKARMMHITVILNSSKPDSKELEQYKQYKL